MLPRSRHIRTALMCVTQRIGRQILMCVTLWIWRLGAMTQEKEDHAGLRGLEAMARGTPRSKCRALLCSLAVRAEPHLQGRPCALEERKTMSGNARMKSSTGIYHIMLRGNNKQTIFFDEEDYGKFFTLLSEKMKQNSLFLYAWCLMPNHFHLLIKEKNETLAEIFRSVLTAFIKWYNAKYGRTGHVFEDRFKSQPVEDPTYFLRVFRYIHRNPLEAFLCERMEDYPYSSYAYYFRSGRYQSGDIIWNLMEKDDLERYHFEKDENLSDFLDIEEVEKRSNEKVIAMVEQSGYVDKISSVKLLPRKERTKVIEMMLKAGVSYRRINALTGVSMSVIRAVSREVHGAAADTRG